MTNMPGLLPLHWDANAGKLYLEIPKLNYDLLYTNSLPYGTGSNDLGLDRGQPPPARSSASSASAQGPARGAQ